MATRNPFEDDVPELPDADAEIMATMAAEGCPADFPPAQEARPAKQTPRRRSPEKTPKAQQEVAEKPSPPMRLVPLAEIAKQDSADYTVKGLFPSRGVVLIYGEPACYKSFTVLSAGVHISEGWPFGGRRVRKRPVVYLALEGGAGLGKRIQAFQAWARKAGKPELTGDFLFWTHGFALHKWNECQALCDSILAGGHSGAVVVIDTLSQATLGVDENSSQMAEAIGNATKIADEIGGLVIVLHHVGKNSANGPRGHSSLMGNVDAAIFASKAKSGRGADWSITKTKDDADGQAMGFKIHVFELGLDEDGDTMTSCAAEPKSTPSSAQAFNEHGGRKRVPAATALAFRSLETALHKIGADNGGAVDRDVWLAEFVRTYPGGKDEKSKKAEFYRQAANMAAEGSIVVDGNMVSFYRPAVSPSASNSTTAQQHNSTP